IHSDILLKNIGARGFLVKLKMSRSYHEYSTCCHRTIYLHHSIKSPFDHSDFYPYDNQKYACFPENFLYLRENKKNINIKMAKKKKRVVYSTNPDFVNQFEELENMFAPQPPDKADQEVRIWLNRLKG